MSTTLELIIRGNPTVSDYRILNLEEQRDLLESRHRTKKSSEENKRVISGSYGLREV